MSQDLVELELKEIKVKAISKLIDEVRPFLVEAGIANTNIVFLGEKLKKSPLLSLDSAIIWLTAFRQVHCNLIPEAKKLVPEHVWQNYKFLGVKGTYEQEQLSIARQIIRMEWIKRPDCLKRKPNSGKRKSK